MTDAILCSPHHDDGKAVYGQRILIQMSITGTDGKTEELGGEFDLCETVHAKPFNGAIDFLRAASEPTVIPGQVVQIEPPKPDPTPAVAPAAPAPPAAPVTQQKDTFICGKCMERVPYMSRGTHARNIHQCKVWEISWTALFDITGWPVCKCGLAIGTSSGMMQHERNAGAGHLKRAEPYHWDASDLDTEVGRALARAVGR